MAELSARCPGAAGLRQHVSRGILLLFAFFYILRYFWPAEGLTWLSAALLLAILAEGIRPLPRVNKLVVGGLFGAGIILLALKGATLSQWAAALMKNANLVTLFICTPMMSLPFFYEDYQRELKVVAQVKMRSLVSFCVLVSLSTHILGVLISIGAVTIIYELLNPHARLYGAEEEFLTTVVRSYCSSGFWSPAWASMIVISSLPGVSWVALIPMGIALSLIYAGLDLAGVALKVKRHPERYPRLQPEKGSRVHWPKIWTMLALALLLILSIILISLLSGWDLMIIISLAALAFPLVSALLQRHLPEYKTGMRDYYDRSLTKINGQVTLFAAAGFLGKALQISGAGDRVAELLPPWLIGYPALLCGAIMLMMILPSLAGVHPVVTGSALAAALTPAALGMNAMTFALTMLTGWLLAILLSPFSATSLLAGAYSGKPSWDISLKLNGAFGLFCIVFFSALISVIGPLLAG